MLQADAVNISIESSRDNQQKDPDLLEGTLPVDEQQARKLVLQTQSFVILDNVLYCVDHKRANTKLTLVPKHSCQRVIKENHRGKIGEHFSGDRVFKSLISHFWWEGNI